MSNSTPIINKVIAYYYKITSIKAQIQGAINFLDKKVIKNFNKDIFWSNCISHAIDYRILKSSNLRNFKNNLIRKKIRNQKKL